MRAKATVLGTSAAWPIPRPGCACPQCAEARAEPALRRTRSAVRIEWRGETILVDAGPDLLQQLEREGLPVVVDAVLLTHTHPDHVLGLDDLARLQPPGRPPLLVHAAAAHQERVAAAFPHLLRPGGERIRFEAFSDGTRLLRPGLVIEGFETGHRADTPTTAVLLHVARPGATVRVAYASDLGEAMPEASRARLEGIDLFVGDGTYLGAAGHGHPGTDDVLALAASLGARSVGLTHLGHSGARDAEVRARLGPGVRVLRDGDELLLG